MLLIIVAQFVMSDTMYRKALVLKLRIALAKTTGIDRTLYFATTPSLLKWLAIAPVSGGIKPERVCGNIKGSEVELS